MNSWKNEVLKEKNKLKKVGKKETKRMFTVEMFKDGLRVSLKEVS